MFLDFFLSLLSYWYCSLYLSHLQTFLQSLQSSWFSLLPSHFLPVTLSFFLFPSYFLTSLPHPGLFWLWCTVCAKSKHHSVLPKLFKQLFFPQFHILVGFMPQLSHCTPSSSSATLFRHCLHTCPSLVSLSLQLQHISSSLTAQECTVLTWSFSYSSSFLVTYISLTQFSINRPWPATNSASISFLWLLETAYWLKTMH